MKLISFFTQILSMQYFDRCTVKTRITPIKSFFYQYLMNT